MILNSLARIRFPFLRLFVSSHDAHDRAVTEVFAAVGNDAGVGGTTHPHGSARGARVRFLVKDDRLFMCGTFIDLGYRQDLPFPFHPSRSLPPSFEVPHERSPAPIAQPKETATHGRLDGKPA